MNQKIASDGFAVKELVITFFVLAGLFAMAFPAYRDYARRDYYKGVVMATAPFKAGVDQCFKKRKTLTGCNAGSFSIPPAIQKPAGALARLQVTNGVIEAVPVAWDGILATDTYILTPRITDDELTWTPSGAGLLHGYTG